MNNSDSSLISVEYQGQDYKYELICSCGNKFQKSFIYNSQSLISDGWCDD